MCFAPSLVCGLFVGVIVWFCSSNCCIICVCLDRVWFWIDDVFFVGGRLI